MYKLLIMCTLVLLSSCGGGDNKPVEYPVIEKNCNDSSIISFDRYVIENNQWGSSGTKGEAYEQCIFLTEFEKNKFNVSWSWNWPFGSGGVKAYPEIIFGSKFGRQSDSNSGLPAPVNQLQEYTITFSYEDNNAASKGERNVAFESWFFPSSDVSFENTQYELMVWLDKTPNIFPGGSFISDVEIDGVTYEFYMGQFPDWVYFAFVRKNPITEGSLRWNPFVEYLIQESYLEEDRYMAGIEFGTEIIEGEGTFTINEFNVSVK